VVNKRVIESLITCGAFDSLSPNRAALWAAAEDAMRWAAQRAEEAASPQMGLFGGGAAASAPPALPSVEQWRSEEALQREREALGFFITGHPLDRYQHDLGKFTNVTIGTLRTRGPKLPTMQSNRGPRGEAKPRVRLGGVIHSVKLRNSKRGERYATFSLEDREGVVDAIAWPDTYRRHEDLVQAGTPVVVEGALEISPERCQVIVNEFTPLARARADAIRQLHVRVPLQQVDRSGLERLRAVLGEHPGACEAFLHLERPNGPETVLALPETIRVAATEDVVDAVERLLGVGVTSFR
jgi:DNA polymerase-3 subunit alpha